MFQHELQTKTDAMKLFRTLADLQKWQAANPTVKVVKGNHCDRTGVTTWNIPQWDAKRKAYCDAKRAYCDKYGSN